MVADILSLCAPWRTLLERKHLSRIKLNVGGCEFQVSRAELGQCKSREVTEALAKAPEDGAYFLDRDGRLFQRVLEFIRGGPTKFSSPEDADGRQLLLNEAKVLGIAALVQHLDTADAWLDALDGKAVAALPTPEAVHRGAPLPRNEARRLERLHGLEILHTEDEHAYNGITRIVAALLDVPIALISLVADDYQWFKSRQGMAAASTPRCDSFCSYMLTPEDPKVATMLVVEDAWRDPRFTDNALVTGDPKIRFYAGSPLVTWDGFRLGGLCVIDRVPRSLTPQQAQTIVNFAQLAVQAIECKQLKATDPEADDCEAEGGGCFQAPDFTAGPLRQMRMRDAVDEVVLLVWARVGTLHWPVLYANEAWTTLTGIRITPPLRFPGAPQVQEIGKSMAPAKTKETGSLWDYLWLKNDGADELVDLWRTVQHHGASDVGMPHPFAKTAVLAPRLAAGSTDTGVSIRFMPAELPLDVAAAAIRPAAQYSAGAWQRVQPQGYGPGQLYFVTVTRIAKHAPERPNGGDSLSKVSPSCIPEDSEQEEAEAEEESRQRMLEVQALREEMAGEAWTDTDPSFKDQRSSSMDAGELPIPGWSRSDSDTVKRGREKPPTPPFSDVRLLRLVGTGHMGKVYFGTWAGACVAVKVVRTKSPRLTQGDLQLALGASLSHPNLAQTYVGEVQDSKLWVMGEWCDGGSLGAYCREPRVEGKGLLELVEICVEVAGALAYLHRQQLPHGAVTPNSVLLKSHFCWKGYICKVTDLGIAALQPRRRLHVAFSSAGSRGAAAATTGHLDNDLVSPHLPPETIAAEQNGLRVEATPAGDVYALGMLMYQVAAGETPWAGLPHEGVPADLASAEVRGRWTRLPAPAPQLLNFLYARCIAVEPRDRPTPEQVIEQLQQIPGAEHMGESDRQDYRKVKTAPDVPQSVEPGSVADVPAMRAQRRAHTYVHRPLHVGRPTSLYFSSN